MQLQVGPAVLQLGVHPELDDELLEEGQMHMQVVVFLVHGGLQVMLHPEDELLEGQMHMQVVVFFVHPGLQVMLHPEEEVDMHSSRDLLH